MDPLTPEVYELQKKQNVLDRLKHRLAEREEEMTDMLGVQEQFEARYTMEVGRLYAEFDEIEAQIAEEELKLVPDDEEIKKRVEELRRRAEESAARSLAAVDAANWQPTAEAKKAYHNLARTIHPDLALDPAEKEKRHILMAELNQAYKSGDQQKLNKLVEDFRNSPDLVSGESVGDDLVRVIRQISQVKTRLIELRLAMVTITQSELFDLRKKVEAESRGGRDVLSQMAERTRVHIKKAGRRLINLKNVNNAAEDYVKEKYGVDITDFRENVK